MCPIDSLMNISNIMVLTQHSKDNEPASKSKEKEVTGRCGSVHPSLGTLIPEPVGYPQLPGIDRKHFNNAPLLALTRQLKCAPFRYESFAPVVGGCCSDCPGFLPRLPTSGEATRSEPIFMLRQSSGWKPRPRAGGSSWLGSASTSRLWGKMSEDQAWSEGFFHSGQICCLAY